MPRKKKTEEETKQEQPKKLTKHESMLRTKSTAPCLQLDRQLVSTEVMKDLAKGLTRDKIMAKLLGKEYKYTKNYQKKVTETTAYEIYCIARRKMTKSFEEDLPTIKGDLYTKTMELYEQCLKSGDRYNALGTLAFLSKLTGAVQPQAVNPITVISKEGVTVNFGFVDNSNNEEQDVEDADFIDITDQTIEDNTDES